MRGCLYCLSSQRDTLKDMYGKLSKQKRKREKEDQCQNAKRQSAVSVKGMVVSTKRYNVISMFTTFLLCVLNVRGRVMKPVQSTLDLREQIYSYLTVKASGRSNPVTGAILARDILGADTANNRRRIQVCIEAIRYDAGDMRVPPCSSDSKPFGYYIPESFDEAVVFAQSCEARAKHTREMANRVMNKLAVKWSTQLAMFRKVA